jgi:hypothetical protein
VNNFYRLLRIIRHTPDYCRYKYAILAAFQGCDDIASFLPETVRARHGSVAEAARHTREDKDALDREFREASGYAPDERADKEDIYRQGPALFYDEKVATSVRFLFESRGIPIQDWSLDPDHHFVFSDGVWELSDFPKLLKTADGDLFDVPISFLGDTKCEALKAASLAAFEPLPAAPHAKKGPAGAAPRHSESK